VIEMLDEVIRTGEKDQVEQARAAMEQIRKEVIGEKEKAFERKKEAALDSLRRQSYTLETSRDYDKAEALWKNYAAKGEFKDDPAVRQEVSRALEYLRGKIEKKREGLDE